MTIASAIHGETAVMTLDGRMDADQAGSFDKECDRLLATGAKNLVIDLAALSYVSSMGLRSFLRAAKGRQEAKGVMALAHFGGFVKQVFDVTRLTPLFRIYASVEEALQSIA